MIVCDFYTDSLRSSAVSILSTVSESHLNVLLLTRFAIITQNKYTPDTTTQKRKQIFINHLSL